MWRWSVWAILTWSDTHLLGVSVVFSPSAPVLPAVSFLTSPPGHVTPMLTKSYDFVSLAHRDGAVLGCQETWRD